MTDRELRELIQTCRRFAESHRHNGEPRTAAVLDDAARALEQLLYAKVEGE